MKNLKEENNHLKPFQIYTPNCHYLLHSTHFPHLYLLFKTSFSIFFERKMTNICKAKIHLYVLSKEDFLSTMDGMVNAEAIYKVSDTYTDPAISWI